MTHFLLRIRRFLILENYSSASSIKYLSTEIEETPFTVSYLIEKLGFSRESAITASKRLKFKSPDQPESVLTLFRSHGFSEYQILKLFQRCPILLMLDPVRILLLKLEFFYSKGASQSDLTKLVCSCPSVLASSLKNELVPSFEFLRGLLESEEMVFCALRRYSGVLRLDRLGSNVECLRENGVPSEIVRYFLQKLPRALSIDVNGFHEAVEEVKKLGFDPKAPMFAHAVGAVRFNNKSTWDRKVDVFRKCGWSEEEFWSAFRSYPLLMSISEKKIATLMDFLVNIVGVRPSAIARSPVTLSLSLKKRIAPRGSVAKLLVSKGLLKEDFSLSGVFISGEELFLRKYIYAYLGEVHNLLDFYRDHFDLSR